MRFDVPESLLQRLRQRREEQRQERAKQVVAGPGIERREGNFIDTLRRFFSGGARVEEAAQSYVHSMTSWQEEIEDQQDAFLLDPGMGPMVYLTSDGRILEDSRGWDGDEVVEVTGYRANAALVVGAKKTGIAELLGLIEPPPVGSKVCSKCKGTRMAAPVEGFGHEFPCEACGARGWLSPASL